MSFGSFIHAPIRGDRGKRILDDKAQYVREDYLKDTRPEEEKRTHIVGKSDGRATKFHVGFYRRSGAVIQPDAERRAQEDARAVGANLRNQDRTAALSALNHRNGNVLVPEPVDAKLFPRRRHYPTREEDVQAMNHARQKVGASRFHLELTPAEQLARARHVEQRLQQQQQGTSSVLGYGRADLPTGGVVDNFRVVPPYTGKDLLSKPKMRPPPKDSLAAQRTVDQVVLDDGSSASGGGGAAFGRRAGGGHQAGGSHSERGYAGAAVGVPRQHHPANRGNRTSSQMSDCFNYTSIINAPTPASRQQQQQSQSTQSQQPPSSSQAAS